MQKSKPMRPPLQISTIRKRHDQFPSQPNDCRAKNAGGSALVKSGKARSSLLLSDGLHVAGFLSSGLFIALVVGLLGFFLDLLLLAATSRVARLFGGGFRSGRSVASLVISTSVGGTGIGTITVQLLQLAASIVVDGARAAHGVIGLFGDFVIVDL